jgi:hypothetical protein
MVESKALSCGHGRSVVELNAGADKLAYRGVIFALASRTTALAASLHD